MCAPVLRLVLRLNAKRSAKGWIAPCPAHEDHTPSLSINQGTDGRALVKCLAGCDTNDVLAAVGMKLRDLFPAKYPQPSRNGSTASPSVRLKLKRTNEQSFDWRPCVEAFTQSHLERLAKWRGYSTEFCHWLKENGFVGLYEGCVAFPVHDRAGNVVAVHCRLKDGSWRYFPQGTKVHPLVIGELVAGNPIHVFESQWDAFAFMDKSGERSGIVITRGASNSALVADVIPENSIAHLWPQNDAPGEKWAKDVYAHVKKICIVKIAKTPKKLKDLNAWTLAGATSDDLLAAMMIAETVRGAELSWPDALNAAVVTSSELHGLELRPRKKLLGDWFCEGDLGLMFASRGVGKTWLALAMAQALSTGGKLGDWQAHAPVKVLYIDGEMPPDLMRDRCRGLKAINVNLEFLNHEILFERTGKVLNITKPDVQRAITQRCVSSGTKMLILDNLSTLASGMKENEADSWE